MVILPRFLLLLLLLTIYNTPDHSLVQLALVLSLIKTLQHNRWSDKGGNEWSSSVVWTRGA